MFYTSLITMENVPDSHTRNESDTISSCSCIEYRIILIHSVALLTFANYPFLNKQMEFLNTGLMCSIWSTHLLVFEASNFRNCISYHFMWHWNGLQNELNKLQPCWKFEIHLRPECAHVYFNVDQKSNKNNAPFKRIVQNDFIEIQQIECRRINGFLKLVETYTNQCTHTSNSLPRHSLTHSIKDMREREKMREFT